MEKSPDLGDDPEVSAVAAAAAGRLDSEEVTGANLRGDRLNVFLLTLLFTMQSLPLSFFWAVSVILKSNPGTTYEELAIFSFSYWPLSMRLLWAPLIDSLHIQKLGRRKSWLVPIQYMIGAILIFTAKDLNGLMSETGKSDIVTLTCIFFAMNFLAATQEIVIDGWALTMLKKNNVGYLSTCNMAGTLISEVVGYTVPILLTSETFCNGYLRNEPAAGGIVTMATLLYSCGAFFFFVTTLIAIFKREKNCSSEDDHVKLNVVQTYSLLWDILKLRSVQLLAMALLTSKIGFAVTDSVGMLKLIDAGVSKEDITIISTAMSGVSMVIPIFAGKYILGPKPISIYLNTVPFRLLLNIPFALLVYYSPTLKSSGGVVNIPLYYYAVIVLLISIQHGLMYIMYISALSFFSRISDPRFGGTYMTLLNTVASLGVSWSSTAALRMIDLLTFTECSSDSTNNCSSQGLEDACKSKKGECITTVNGYYVEVVLCTIIGIVWYVIFGKILKNLQKKNSSQWLVNVKQNKAVGNEKSSFSM